MDILYLKVSLQAEGSFIEVVGNELGCDTSKLFEVFYQVHLVEVAALVADGGPVEGRICFFHSIGVGETGDPGKQLWGKSQPLFTLSLKLL